MGSKEPRMARGARPRPLIIPSPLPESEGETEAPQRESWQPISLGSKGLKLTHLPLGAGEGAQVGEMGQLAMRQLERQDLHEGASLC